MTGRRTIPTALTLVATLMAGFGVGLRLILRYKPKQILDVARKLFSRVLNPILMAAGDRFHLEARQQVLYHAGRNTGREYRTPLCVSATPEGFIVPAAFGPDVDWLANLRTTPKATIRFEGATYPVTAEMIDRAEAVNLAGGSPGCSCWDEFRVEDFAILRPGREHTANVDPERSKNEITARFGARRRSVAQVSSYGGREWPIEKGGAL